MMKCAGKVVGKYTAKAAALVGRPELLGHKRRDYCGQDVSDLIAEVPEDGEIHKIECPRCGNVMQVKRTPPEV